MVSTLIGFTKSVGQGVLDLLFPGCCSGCGLALPQGEYPVCNRCLLRLERVSVLDASAQLRRLPEAHVLDGGFALWHFDKGGLLQHLQHALKYNNRPRIGEALGRLIGAAWSDDATAICPDGVVPVPLHRVRLFERGYNQSAALAKGIGSVVGAPVLDDVLVRKRTTRSQTRLSREARWANVSGAFATPGAECARDRRLLLVDDVLTTGATAAAAAHALKSAGAASVHLLALGMARH